MSSSEMRSDKDLAEMARTVLASVTTESALEALLGRALVLGLRAIAGEDVPKQTESVQVEVRAEGPAEPKAAQEPTTATGQPSPEAGTERGAAPDQTAATPVVACPSCASTATQKGPAQQDKPAGFACISCGHTWQV